MEVYLDAIQATKQFCPEFTFGMIVQGLKMWDNATLYNYMRKAFEFKKKYPELIIGFDMVQEEDLYN